MGIVSVSVQTIPAGKHRKKKSFLQVTKCMAAGIKNLLAGINIAPVGIEQRFPTGGSRPKTFLGGRRQFPGFENINSKNQNRTHSSNNF